jgi:uncharacterized iron-regulated protein
LKTALLLILLILLEACSGAPVRLNISETAEVSRMMADLGQARVVFVGEFHDQRDHHLLQLDVIKELHRQGKSLAIGLEMFDLEKQSSLDEWIKGSMPLQEFVNRYQKGWSINWAEYDSIMLFARNNRIPMVALDAPPDIVRLVTHGGPGMLGYDEMRRLPDGVTTAMLPSYRKFMASAFRSHDIPGSKFDNFCAAQGLRNSTMAKLITGYLRQNPEKSMVVIAGVGHAMRRAVPSAVQRDGLTLRIVIPKVDGLYDELERGDMDYFVDGKE